MNKSVEMSEKEDEVFKLVVDVAEKQKALAESRYCLSIARAEIKALRQMEKENDD